LFLWEKKIASEWKKGIVPLLLLLVTISGYLNFMLFNNTGPGKILGAALQKMEQNKSCLTVEIQEKGQTYNLNFSGNFKNGEIYGQLPAYELEVYKHASGILFIKDLKDNLWKKAPALELQSLQEYFISPFELLATWSPLFSSARLVNIPESREKAILLHVPATELAETGFLQNQPPDCLSQLKCLVFLELEDLFINQVVFSLQNDEGTGSIFSRTFSFSYSPEDIGEIMPAGIEQLCKDAVL
jgi:hypothetical protein